jgi:hypothetical protein
MLFGECAKNGEATRQRRDELSLAICRFRGFAARLAHLVSPLDRPSPGERRLC